MKMGNLRKSGLLIILIISSTLLDLSVAGTVYLNGLKLQASDLRQIDSYVSSALPIYPKGFQLYNAGTGNRPIIIKMSTSDSRKPGPEHPNPGYYTSLPAIIPQGFDGVATSSFLLGSPIRNPVSFNTESKQVLESGRQQPTQSDEAYPINPVVVETSNFESNLPKELRNPFYSNQDTASSLAQESLPTAGEEVVDMWNTNKIREGKVGDLLTKAGLI